MVKWRHVLGQWLLELGMQDKTALVYLSFAYKTKFINIQLFVIQDYVIAVPENVYTPDILDEEPQDRAGEFIRSCGGNNFYIGYESDEGGRGKVVTGLGSSANQACDFSAFFY